MSTETRPAPGLFHQSKTAEVPEVILYGHSTLFYWWPLWVTGYVMALLTWSDYVQADISEKPEWFHPSRNLGAIYTLLFLLLIVITSSHVRGIKAALIIVALSFVALWLAYLDWWERILDVVGHERVYMKPRFLPFLLHGTLCALVRLRFSH